MLLHVARREIGHRRPAASRAGNGSATGSSPAFIRLRIRAARRRASSAVITPCRPTVTRTDFPSARLWTTYIFVPEA